MGSGGKGHKFWCDKCQCYVDFSDFETCESVCEYCEARKARAEAAEAEVGRLRAELAAMPRPEDRCHGEWPCEASTALAYAEAEVARAEAHAEAAEAEVARLRADLAKARAEGEARGAAAERAAVVAYLHTEAGRIHRGESEPCNRESALLDSTRVIERGEHRREG